MLTLTRLSCILFAVFAVSVVVAQDPPAGEPATPTPVELPTLDANNVDISTDDLTSTLYPMLAEEIKGVTEEWQKKAKATLEEIAQINIAMRSAEGEQKSQLTSMRSTLESEKSRRLECFRIAFLAYRGKGGDLATYKAWYDDVSGIQVDPKDAAATTSLLLDWAKKEDGGIRWAKSVAFALLTLLVFKFLSGIAGRVTNAAMKRAKIKVSEGLRRFFIGIVKKLVMVLGLILALSMLGVDIGPFIAAIGVGGFVIGFALQDTLGNFAAGIMILMYRPFEIGHGVTAAGVTGKVEDISLVSTRFLTPDNQTIIVPNGKVWGGVITNITGNANRRVDMVFGIGYGDDIAKAEKILREIVENHPKTLKDPEPSINVSELADSSVNFNVRPWAATSDYWDVKYDILRTVKERFDAEGISIPYPQRDVHMHQVT